MGNVFKKKRNRRDFTQLTENDIQKLLKNTPFDREEIIEWHKGFLVRNEEKKID